MQLAAVLHVEGKRCHLLRTCKVEPGLVALEVILCCVVVVIGNVVHGKHEGKVGKSSCLQFCRLVSVQDRVTGALTRILRAPKPATSSTKQTLATRPVCYYVSEASNLREKDNKIILFCLKKMYCFHTAIIFKQNIFHRTSHLLLVKTH